MDFEAVEREADQHAEALMCPQPAVVVRAMQGDPRYAKCPRCWHFHGELLNHDALCDRCCNSILEGWPDHESVPFIKANRAAQARYFGRATVASAVKAQNERLEELMLGAPTREQRPGLKVAGMWIADKQGIHAQTLDVLLPESPTREQIERLEACLLDVEAQGHGVELPTWHEFADGLVARTILIRAGTVLTGAAHKAEHLNICHGDITVWTEGGMRRLTGYHVLPSLPGAKRAGVAHADTHWTTVHANPGNERDIARLEDALVADAPMLQSRRLALPH